MKKIIGLLLTSSFIISGLWSCTGDPVETGDQTPHGAGLRGDPPAFFNLFESFASNYERVYFPANVEEENISKTVFASAAGRFLVSETYGQWDVYAGAYQGWRTAVALNPSTRSMDGTEDVELSRETFSATRANDTGYYEEGKLYKDIMDSVYIMTGTRFLSTDDVNIFTYIYNYINSKGTTLNQMGVLLEMMQMSPLMEQALEFRDPVNNSIEGISRPRGYFSMRDGVNYLSTLNTEQQNILTVLGRMLEVALSDNSLPMKEDFLNKLEALCAKQENQWIFSEGYITREQADKMIFAVSTAVFANEFWRYYDQARVTPTLKVDKSVLFLGPQTKTINITSNTSWWIEMAFGVDVSPMNGRGDMAITAQPRFATSYASKNTFNICHYDADGNKVTTNIEVYTPPNGAKNYSRNIDQLDVAGEGGTYTVNVTSNCAWSTYISDFLIQLPGVELNSAIGPIEIGWCSHQAMRVVNDGQFTITAKPNKTGTNRSYTVYTGYHNGKELVYLPIMVNQSKDWSHSVSPKTWYMGRNGGSITVTVTCPASVNWEAHNIYTEVIAGGKGNGTFVLTVPRNSSGPGVMWITQIKFYYEGTYIGYELVEVIQD